jgi:hypothetical protein
MEMKLYHGTSSANEESIRANGLVPNYAGSRHLTKPSGEVGAGVYFTPYREYAEIYGDLLLEMEADVEVRKFDSRPIFTSHHDCGGVIMNVETEIWNDEPGIKDEDFEVVFNETIAPERLRFIMKEREVLE